MTKATPPNHNPSSPSSRATPADEDTFEIVDDIESASGAASRSYNRRSSSRRRQSLVHAPQHQDDDHHDHHDHHNRHSRHNHVSPLSSEESLALQEPIPYGDDEKGMLPGISKYSKSVYRRLTSWGDKDVLIAVMGMTGSGKTTFISKATGRTDLNIGHQLSSCTRDIQVVETRIDGQRVHFVDTPGFSDTSLSDTDVLQMIADYLAVAYRKEMKLSGIIYLHPISDTRMTHHGVKNLSMFRRLTGEKNLKNVLLVTSKWDQVDAAVGETREAELRDDYWRLLISMGAQTRRHRGTPQSAQDIARSLCANTPFYLQLQEEMGADNKPLRETTAGRELMAEISRIKEDHQREIEEMQHMMRNSADESKAVIEALRQESRRQQEQLERILRDERNMNEEAVRSLQERINALENRRGGCTVM
jgi:GTP-binding protein EngB required for normal cell division